MTCTTSEILAVQSLVLSVVFFSTIISAFVLCLLPILFCLFFFELPIGITTFILHWRDRSLLSIYVRTDNIKAKEKDRMTNNYRQSTTLKTKEKATRKLLWTEREVMCSGKISSSFSTSANKYYWLKLEIIHTTICIPVVSQSNNIIIMQHTNRYRHTTNI